MESRDYETILNAIPDTGVFVIRASDCSLLYFNRRVAETAPQVELGMACQSIWNQACGCCPLRSIGEEEKSQSVGYNEAFGGVVDITATRTLWEGETPAFVITVSPRMDAVGYTYRKILRVDLVEDHCDVLKTDQGSWQPKDGPLSEQLAQFAVSGSIHSEDAERFGAFVTLDHLRSAIQQDQQTTRTLIYRRQTESGYRWNLMEVIPDRVGEVRSAILCVKDIQNALREGLERVGLTLRGQELIRSLGERNFNIYTIDLDSGSADLIRVDGQMRENLAAAPWDELREQIEHRLHESYQDEFARRFSLSGLRQARENGQQKTELLCQWRNGEDYSYISATAYFGQGVQGKRYTVLALQDMDERMRQELAHTKRDMQMAAILKSRFKTMNTVDLDSGRCQLMDLTQPAGAENTWSEDYNHYVQRALAEDVHPEDGEKYWELLSLEHLREKTLGLTGDCEEEVCIYRRRGEPVRWMELRVIYSRRKEQVMVNILGQDVTNEKRQEELRRRALEDRTYIISSLSSLFFSTYYIDLEQDTFRTVTQLRQVKDILGSEVNCTSALEVYANHFIHPDDREEYLSVMNVQNMRQNLRWWQPYVAVEYRKLSDEIQPDGPDSYRWVRATAVLARTGDDDMPKTVVYAAQDITDSKRKTG